MGLIFYLEGLHIDKIFIACLNNQFKSHPTFLKNFLIKWKMSSPLKSSSVSTMDVMHWEIPEGALN